MKLTKEGIAVIEGDTHISKWVEETGKLDFDNNVLPRVLKHIKLGDTVLDIGAFIGDHTLSYAKHIGRYGRILAFECNPEAFECLDYNMSNVDCNKLLYPYAVTDMQYEAMSFVKEENAGASYIKLGEGPRAGMTIDILNLDRCDFIKIDIEGFEVKALKGALKTIIHCKPIMLIEVNEGALNRLGFTANDIFDILRSIKYRFRNVYAEEPMQGPQYDIMCFPV